MKPTTIARHITDNLQARYLLVTNDDRQVDLHFIHQQPGSSSDIAILIIAQGNAKVQLSATVVIPPDTPNIKTNLDIKIITDTQATVTAAPNLEISNNQVQASHSLSTVQLTSDEIFYMSSRGLNFNQARQLLIDSYLAKFHNAIKL